MDVGCYTIHQLRTLAGAEPDGRRRPRRSAALPGVDRWMQAEMRFADGRTGGIECSMWSRKLLTLRRDGDRVDGAS